MITNNHGHEESRGKILVERVEELNFMRVHFKQATTGKKCLVHLAGTVVFLQESWGLRAKIKK